MSSLLWFILLSLKFSHLTSFLLAQHSLVLHPLQAILVRNELLLIIIIWCFIILILPLQAILVKNELLLIIIIWCFIILNVFICSTARNFNTENFKNVFLTKIYVLKNTRSNLRSYLYAHNYFLEDKYLSCLLGISMRTI